MCSQEAENEERHLLPGIDYVVTREQLDLVDVNRTLAAVTSVECGDVNRCITALDGERPEEQLAAIRLLSGLTSYHFVPDHPTEPFKPMWTMGERRSLLPTDLLQEQVDVIAEFAPTVTHLGLRARLCDLSWFMQRRRREMAEFATAAYCDLVESVRAGRATFSFEDGSAWGIGAKDALQRAARISHATRWELPISQRLRSLVAELIAAAHHDGRDDDFWRIAEVDLDHKITPTTEVAAMAEALVDVERLRDNPDARLSLWQLAARGYRLARDEENANRCMVASAECHVQKADLAGSPILEAAFLQDAIQALRNDPNTRERREELTARLRNVQPRIRDEMGHFSTEIDLTKIVERSVAVVRGHSWPTALLSLVLCDQPPTPDEIRQTAIVHAQEFPLQAIMPMQVHDFQGRVVFRAPGMGGADAAQEQQLRYLMAFHRGNSRQVTVAGAINPIRQAIASEHLISDDTILELLRDSPFIPKGHEYIFARAICHFLAGEDIEAVSLLTPQLENSLRHILALNGHDTTTADADGIQTEASLSILLNADRPWRDLMEQIIPSRYINEIDLLFNFPGGPSVRNQVAHGKVPVGGFWDHDFVYATWLIIHLALLPMAGRWGDVEEIFARVTGLYRASDVDEEPEQQTGLC
ncbi:DUF7380 domain-containing protein [Cereibacter sphaeroides]|uniref:DUF7380 domain-containing protein n=1 Tax=Cereibacter sphaeroides TaxID=1063 RepID=UPI003FCEC1BD